MTPFASALLLLVSITLPNGSHVPARHIRLAGGERYVAKVARWVDRAEELTGVRRALIGAVLVLESSLDESAVSRVGAVGLGQLFGRAKREWKAVCRLDPEGCGEANVLIAARVLSRSMQRCGGSEAGGLALYRGTGRCAADARVRHTLMVARTLESETARRTKEAEKETPMIKSKEMSDPNSCLSKAADDEPVFVLRAKDPLFPAMVKMWSFFAEGRHEPSKMLEARGIADEGEAWRKAYEARK